MVEDAERYPPDEVEGVQGAEKIVREQMKRSHDKEGREVGYIKLYKKQPASDENVVTN